jgi:RTX calcium-binding nonapeptide repeat (4 copies)/FG-GAP-like repeat
MMSLPTHLRKWFSRKSTPIQNKRKAAARRRPAPLTLELLEERLAPAIVSYNAGEVSFTGRTDNLGNNLADNVAVSTAGNLVAVFAAGDTLSISGAAPTDLFTLSTTFQTNDTLVIDTTKATVTKFNINLGNVEGLAESALVGDQVTFFPTIIAADLTVESEKINLFGIATTGDVSLTSWQDLTGGVFDNVPDITGDEVSLNVTGPGKQIGVPGSATVVHNPLEVNVGTRLNATTNNGHMALHDVDLTGNLPLGTLDAGNAMILLSAWGAITDGNNGVGVNLKAAGGVNLTTFGLDSSIGTDSTHPLRTEIGALSAATNDGSVFVKDSGSSALGINTVLVKEAILGVGGFAPFSFNNQIVVFVADANNVATGENDVWVEAEGDIIVGSVAAPHNVTIKSNGGQIMALPGLADVNVLAQEVDLEADGAVGQAGNPIQLQVERFSASTTDGGIFLSEGAIEGTAWSVVANGADKEAQVTSAASKLFIRKIIAQNGNVTVRNDVGSLESSADVGTVPVTGNIVDLTGATGIGALPNGTRARSLLTFTGKGSANETVTIGARTYTLVSALTGPDQILIGVDQVATARNLAFAINGDAQQQGVSFGAGTVPHSDVSAEADDGTRATALLTFTGKGSANETVTIGARTYTLVSTTPSGPNQVLIGSDKNETARNLAFAINGDAQQQGVSFGAGTVPHPDVSAEADDGTVVVTARVVGSAGNSIFVLQTSNAAFWGSLALQGGSDVTVVVTARVAGSAGNSIVVSETSNAAFWASPTLLIGSDVALPLFINVADLEPLQTKAVDLRATVSNAGFNFTPAARIRINNADPGLESVAAKTNAGDALITFADGSLQFMAGTLSATSSGESVTFETTTGNVLLDEVNTLVGVMLPEDDVETGNITVTAAGAITDDPNDPVLTGNIATLNAGFGIGTPTNILIGTVANPIDATNVRAVNATTTVGGIFISSEADELELSATTKGDLVNPFTFLPLVKSDIDVTTTGDLILGLVSAVNQITLEAGGAIRDGGGSANDIAANTLELVASTGIGTSDNPLETSVNSLTARGPDDDEDPVGGGIFLTNDKTLELTSAVATGEVSVTARGNLLLGTVTGETVTVSATGRLIDNNDIMRVDTEANRIFVGNSGLITGTLIAYNSGDGDPIGGLQSGGFYNVIVLGNPNDPNDPNNGWIQLAFAGFVQDLTSQGSGHNHLLQADSVFFKLSFDPDEVLTPVVNITAESVTLKGSRIGDSYSFTRQGEEEPTIAIDRIETKDATSLTATSARGGIYVDNDATLPSNLTLTATARGREGDIDIDTGGNILLRTVTALGNTVKLRAAGWIHDDPENNTDVNITAMTFDVVAPGGIGTQVDPLETEVDEQGAADAGSNGFFLVNVGALLITEAALEGSGSGPLTFTAASLTVDIHGLVTLTENRDLVLRTTSGNIVFLDSDATIKTQGTGTITIQAGTDVNSTDPYHTLPVAVLGNLTTVDRDIVVRAPGSITIGLLDAGMGNVTVESTAGIIVDGNEEDVNVKAGTATLSGSAPTPREAELNETSRIAEAAAVFAEAAAKQASFEAFESGVGIVLDAQLQAEDALATAEVAYVSAQTLVDFQEIVVAQKQSAVDAATRTSLALGYVYLVVELAAAIAQAVPAVGDGGAFLILFVADVALFAADAVTFGLETDLGNAQGVLDDLQATSTTAQAQLFAAQAGFTQADATAEAFEESFSIAKGAADRTNSLSDAAAIVRDQAIAARDQVNVIGTASVPLGIQVTDVVNVTAGPTDSYLEVTDASAVGLIQSTGNVTLISKGALTDSDGDGDDIIASGLTIRARDGIGTVNPLDPIETRVSTLNATNTSSGDIVIANTAEALDITGITNESGDVDISNQGGTLTVSGDITSAGSITLHAGNDAATTGVNVIVTGTLIAPLGATITGSDNDDTFTIAPSEDTPITVDGGGGTDTLNFNADGLPVTIEGNTITVGALKPVTFDNFEVLNITNAEGGGSITLVGETGVANLMTLTGTGQGAGTFTLSPGLPLPNLISFSGVDSFTINAGDLGDTITVEPFATPVLPWSVAVTINGGGTDSLIYNNVAGLVDHTSVTATAEHEGHIDSPGVSSALDSQVVSFTGVENITANANPGEDEKLTVNLRDTLETDTANLNGNDLQLDGLFNLTIGTHYIDLTLNGRSGDDNFDITPGLIPVFVDGGDPLGATAGDSINFNPTAAYTLEPGPQNDEGRLTADGAALVNWDHIEGLSVTGGGPGTFLGTNGADEITIVAGDSSTPEGTNGVRDFTVSLNEGPSVLFRNTGVLSVDALAGDDNVKLQGQAPSNAGWDLVQMTVLGNNGNDSIEAESGAEGTFDITLNGGAGDDFLSADAILIGGPGDDFLEGGAGNDQLFGNEGDDTLVASSGDDTFDGGPGFDTILIRGTSASDVIDVFQNGPSAVADSGYALDWSLNGVAQTDTITQDTSGSPQIAGTQPTVEEVRIEAGLGNNLIRVGVSDAYSDLVPDNGVPNQSLRFHVVGDASASDRLLVRDDGEGDLVVLHQASDNSGSVRVAPGVTITDGGTGLADVVYEGIERLDITPLDSVSGGTGTDGKGRILVFPSDPFESNDTRLNAGQLTRVVENPTSPSIDPGGITTPFEVNGDEDWYEFRPSMTNTFQLKILFDQIQELANGRPGLPGDGDLSLDIYDADGNLITSGVADADGNNRTAIFGATNDPNIPEFNRIFIRVKGAGDQPSLSINRYDFDDLPGIASGIPGGSGLDTVGPQVTGVNITEAPEYNLFVPKPTDGPTPLVPSMEVHFVDSSVRAPGFLYPAIDPDLFDGPVGQKPAMGLFSVVGDRVGNVPILDVVLTNDTVVVGEPATATVKLIFDLSSPIFAGGLPDDRYTLTVLDGLSDPTGSKLDGESNAAQPTASASFPSGDGQEGGDFLARFTVDSRPEIGTYANGAAYVDINGNGVFDPQGQDGDQTNRDITFVFGSKADVLFAGDFAAADATTSSGFDKLGAYGNGDGGPHRWLLDFNSDGVPDFEATAQGSGIPVAGNFDPDHPGDEIGLLSGTTWTLDINGDNVLENKEGEIKGHLDGDPIVGDFDGDGKDDLGVYKNGVFSFDLAANGLTGDADATIAFGFFGPKEVPVAADLNQDGIDDIGLFIPEQNAPPSNESGEWFWLVSTGTPVAGTVDTLNHPFTPVPFGNDQFFRQGDDQSMPIVGNFDPPVTSSGTVGIGDTSTTPQDPVVTPDPVGATPAPSHILVTGADAGAGPHVQVFDASSRTEKFSFYAYGEGFQGGVRVAAADVTGDGTEDIITGTGPGAGPHVKVFDGVTGQEVRSFFAFSPSFLGGISVAGGDVDGDGFADIVVAADAGADPHVIVFSGRDNSVLQSFFAYAPSFSGGVRVAVGDVNGDGRADIVTTPASGAGAHVKVFDGRDLTVLASFMAFDLSLPLGGNVAVGDVNGDGRADILTALNQGAGTLLSAPVKVFDGATFQERASLSLPGTLFSGGIRVGLTDVNGDNQADLVLGGGPGGVPVVRLVDGLTLQVLDEFFAYNSAFQGGVFVA